MTDSLNEDAADKSIATSANLNELRSVHVATKK